MERIDIARRFKRWKLSMKFLTSCCNVMVRSRSRVSRWEDLNRDLLVKIFDKLNTKDITMGASRVCVSWFLAAHDRSLWRIIDLTSLEQLILLNPKARLPLNMWGIDKGPLDPQYLRQVLTEVTKFSCEAPTSLFFNFYSYIEEENLIIAAKRMPNIEKLVFPKWSTIREKPFQFAFSQWKNLKTLIIIKPFKLIENYIDFQVIGESCTNLTNLKLIGVYSYSARQIVGFLPNLKRLSLLCYMIRYKDVIKLVTGLKNLKFLNVSHCIFWNDNYTDHFVRLVVTQKVEKFIMCSQDCVICMENLYFAGKDMFTAALFLEKHWQKDEIKELEI